MERAVAPACSAGRFAHLAQSLMKIIQAKHLEGPNLRAPHSGLYAHLNPGPDAASWPGWRLGPEETARALKLIRSLAPRKVSSPSELAQNLSAHVQAHGLNANANTNAMAIARAAARRGIPFLAHQAFEPLGAIRPGSSPPVDQRCRGAWHAKQGQRNLHRRGRQTGARAGTG